MNKSAEKVENLSFVLSDDVAVTRNVAFKNSEAEIRQWTGRGPPLNLDKC